jgi:GDPmannose 4,6-dehydratase
MHFGDLTDPAALRHALGESDPHEIYNLGAQSHVHSSFTEPEYTMRATGLPILTILEHVRSSGVKAPWPRLRIYQASSSELFGTEPAPQNEETRFSPRSPYAIAKLAAHQSVMLYRQAYGMFAVSGILHNHESPHRGLNFVTRKITHAVARIKKGIDRELVLGNLDARRDWGFAGDSVGAMWLMLQQDEPRDFVVATGETHSVREFCEAAFDVVGLNWREYVRIDDKFKRPAEVPDLRGDATRIREALGWKPLVGFQELVEMMVRADLELVGVAELEAPRGC